MSDNKNSDNKQNSNEKVSVSKAIKEVKDEIVAEAKLLTLQKTSSAFGIISKTKELIKLEGMQVNP